MNSDLAPRDMLLVAPPDGRRARALGATLDALGWPPARVISYLDVLAGRVRLADEVRPSSVVRLESPGEDIQTELALIELGGGQPVDLAVGELAPSRAWYGGFSRVLHQLETDLVHAPPHTRMQQTDHILTMFDKPATHARLTAAGVPVPEALPEIHSFDELVHAARERGWSRVFVKLAYGSSGSGIVALQWAGTRVSAVTTVRREGGRLFNSKRLIKLEDWAEVQALIDDLAPHRLHVERWLPKASFGGGTVDLRVAVIGGRAQHALVRTSRGPITNLHLGNQRGDIEALRAELGAERWAEVGRTAEAALNAFPGALYGGVDLLLTPGWKHQAVLEVNAFGDYHRGILVDGRDTYAAELAALGGAEC
ncbi:STM4014 family protein [Deinococcus arenicola]|uniref:STM4014 family protein n=1 Tax=Deinococcus arenicola TaxID=2994950 RepID=A0ABU4DNZ6_9DEIO|nr:STM4014 family protein [Deinococcus sp. ZS9-10]MDV6373414.1 STM4014 family protein [Deinococcus sp. ZS9-10]